MEGSLEEAVETVYLEGGLMESSLWGKMDPRASMMPSVRCMCGEEEPAELLNSEAVEKRTCLGALPCCRPGLTTLGLGAAGPGWKCLFLSSVALKCDTTGSPVTGLSGSSAVPPAQLMLRRGHLRG